MAPTTCPRGTLGSSLPAQAQSTPSPLHTCESRMHGLSPALQRKVQLQDPELKKGDAHNCTGQRWGCPMGWWASGCFIRPNSPAQSAPHLELSWKFQWLSAAKKKCVKFSQRFCGNGKPCGDGGRGGTLTPRDPRALGISRCHSVSTVLC